MNKRFLIIVSILEILIISLMAFRAFKPSEQLNVNWADWEESSSDTVEFKSPYFYINKGSYAMTIDYSSDSDATVEIYSEAENNFDEYTTVLHNQKKSEKIQFEAYGPTDNMQISIVSTDRLDVNSIHISRTRDMEKRYFTIALFVFLFINIIYCKKEFFYNNRFAVISIFAIGFLASLPLFSYGTEVGHDLDFHLMRIEGITLELSACHFPVRVHSYYNYGHGYPVSIFYGDILLYFPALLRILGFQAIQAYKIYAFSINLFTALFCYYAGLKICKKDTIALFFSAAFSLSTYRFVDVYVRNAVGEYTAMMFFPLIALGIYQTYFENTDDKKSFNRNGLFFISLGMTGIITCHILTTEMVCIFLLIFAIIYFKRTFTRKVITTLGLSIITTALLSAWFIIPFIDYYVNVPVQIKDTNNAIAQIQVNGAYLTQYFAFFKSIFGTNDQVITGRLSITPGITLMIVLLIALYLVINKKASSTICKITLSAIFLLFISSNLFPWDYISSFKIGNILAQIQFPWRWLMFACLLLAFLFGYLLKIFEDDQSILNFNISILYFIFSILLLFQICADNSSYTNDALNIKNPKYSTDMDGTDYREYYRSGSDFFSLTFEVSGDTITSGYLTKQTGTDYTFNITSDDAGAVTLPILNYKGFAVRDDTGKNYVIKDGAQKEITIDLPSNFAGNLYVSFKEPVIWRIAELLSLISFISIIVFFKLSIRNNSL